VNSDVADARCLNDFFRLIDCKNLTLYLAASTGKCAYNRQGEVNETGQ
jgi:hypothetical protein